jgi:hypothetical protein
MKNYLWFDVAVHKAALVQVADALGHLPKDVARFVLFKSLVSRPRDEREQIAVLMDDDQHYDEG